MNNTRNNPFIVREYARFHAFSTPNRLFYREKRKKEERLFYQNNRPYVADPKGFEPLTFWSVARRSIQLS